MAKSRSFDNVETAIITMAYGLSSSEKEKSSIVTHFLEMYERMKALEVKVTSLEAQLAQQGKSVSDLGQRTAGLQVYGKP